MLPRPSALLMEKASKNDDSTETAICRYYGPQPEAHILTDGDGKDIEVKSIVIPTGVTVSIKESREAESFWPAVPERSYGAYTGPMRLPISRDDVYHRKLSVSKVADEYKYIRFCTADERNHIECAEKNMADIQMKEIYRIKTLNRINFSYSGEEQKKLGSVKIPKGKKIYLYRSKKNEECRTWMKSGSFGSITIRQIADDQKHIAFMLINEEDEHDKIHQFQACKIMSLRAKQEQQLQNLY